jgi:tRNA A37 threonylcarbamoyladenosine modification protein TsaB
VERYYNKDDDDDDEEPFFGSDGDEDDEDEEDEDGEAIAYIDQQSIIDVMQLDLAQTELNHQLLDRAHKIAKQNWFWWFKSADTRMKEIEDIYRRLVKLTEKPEEKE